MNFAPRGAYMFLKHFLYSFLRFFKTMCQKKNSWRLKYGNRLKIIFKFMDMWSWFCKQVMAFSPGFCGWISLCFFLFFCQCQILLQAPIRAVSNRTGTDHSNGIYIGPRASSTVSRMIKQQVDPTVSELKGILIAANVC